MIIGIGIDIVELKRIAKISTRQKRFADRILTSLEKETYERLTGKRQIEYLAGRFAAKEAFAKAYGTGIGTQLSFHEIQVENDEKGKPHLTKPLQEGVHLSITHSTEYAAAQVIIERS
jgi:holo-[acyl-carrier protein] synthase